MKQRTYLLIDSLMLTVLACVLEAINILALKRVFKYELFSLSLVVPMCALLQMRWRWTSAPMLVLSAVVFCLCQGANGVQYGIYIVGNLFAMANLVWFFVPHKQISGNVYLTLAFTVTCGLLVVLGRAIASAMWGYSFVAYLSGFLATEAFNIVLALVIMFVAFKQKSLFVYQPQYLKDMAEERERERQKQDNMQRQDNVGRPYYDEEEGQHK